MSMQNLFRVLYTPKPIRANDVGKHVPIYAYVVIPTWEDLIEYMHKEHGSLLNVDSVNYANEDRVNVLAPYIDEEIASLKGKVANLEWEKKQLHQVIISHRERMERAEGILKGKGRMSQRIHAALIEIRNVIP